MNGGEILNVLTWLVLCSGLGVGAYFLASKLQKQFWTDVLQPKQKSTAADVEELRLKDRAEARAAYERIILAKLDVMKTAVAMGFSDAGLQALDQRLEGLIGADKVAGIIDPIGSQALPSADLLDTDIQNELTRLRSTQRSDAVKHG